MCRYLGLKTQANIYSCLIQLFIRYRLYFNIAVINDLVDLSVEPLKKLRLAGEFPRDCQ